MTGVVPAVRDDGKTARAHTPGGGEARRELRRANATHVFDPGVDLDDWERQVWAAGTYAGRVPGATPRSDYDRFGRRVQTGRPDRPVYWVEIEGEVVDDIWIYH